MPVSIRIPSRSIGSQRSPSSDHCCNRSDWPRVRLGDVLSMEYGKSLPARARDPHGEFPVAGSNGPDGNHKSALVSAPGIVVGRKGSAGRVYWYKSDFWPIDTTYYVVPKVSLDMRWTYYLLSHLRLDYLATTTGVPGLNRNDVCGLEFRLPPLSKQRRIVDILDQADRVRRLRAAADAKADSIIPALFGKMFGDPYTNPMMWPKYALDQLATITTGNTPSRKRPEYYGDAIDWVKSDNLNTASHYVTGATERLSNLGKRVARTAPPGSTLVTCIAGSRSAIGNSALTEREVAFNQQINFHSTRRKTTLRGSNLGGRGPHEETQTQSPTSHHRTGQGFLPTDQGRTGTGYARGSRLRGAGPCIGPAREYQMDRPATEPALMLRFRHFRI